MVLWIMPVIAILVLMSSNPCGSCQFFDQFLLAACNMAYIIMFLLASAEQLVSWMEGCWSGDSVRVIAKLTPLDLSIAPLDLSIAPLDLSNCEKYYVCMIGNTSHHQHHIPTGQVSVKSLTSPASHTACAWTSWFKVVT